MVALDGGGIPGQATGLTIDDMVRTVVVIERMAMRPVARGYYVGTLSSTILDGLRTKVDDG